MYLFRSIMGTRVCKAFLFYSWEIGLTSQLIYNSKLSINCQVCCFRNHRASRRIQLQVSIEFLLTTCESQPTVVKCWIKSTTSISDSTPHCQNEACRGSIREHIDFLKRFSSWTELRNHESISVYLYADLSCNSHSPPAFASALWEHECSKACLLLFKRATHEYSWLNASKKKRLHIESLFCFLKTTFQP